MMFLQLRSATMFATIIISLYFIPVVKAQDSVKQAPNSELPKIIRKAGGVLQGNATQRIEPVYPLQAQAAGVGGQVILEVIVDEEGKPISVRTVFGHPLLRDAAVEAAYGWAWPPTTLSGVPIKVIGMLTFNFHPISKRDAREQTESLMKEIDTVRKEIRGNSKSAELYYRLALAYDNLSFYQNARQDAIETYQQAIALKPDFLEAYYRLGLVYLKQHSIVEAAEAFKQAVGLKPDFAMGYYGLGEAYTGPRYREQAMEALRQSIKIKPDYAEAYYLLGWNYSQVQRNKEALEAFKQATIISPDWAEARLALALAYLQQQEKNSAIDEQRVIKGKYPRMAAYLLKQINK
jgi:TonB family protein